MLNTQTHSGTMFLCSTLPNKRAGKKVRGRERMGKSLHCCDSRHWPFIDDTNPLIWRRLKLVFLLSEKILHALLLKIVELLCVIPGQEQLCTHIAFSFYYRHQHHTQLACSCCSFSDLIASWLAGAGKAQMQNTSPHCSLVWKFKFFAWSCLVPCTEGCPAKKKLPHNWSESPLARNDAWGCETFYPLADVTLVFTPKNIMIWLVMIFSQCCHLDPIVKNSQPCYLLLVLSD